MTVLDFVDFELDLSTFPQPANDDFANAFVLSGMAMPVVVAPPATLSASTTEPGRPARYAAIRARLRVFPDTASRGELCGESGTDWFWSADPLDLLDIDPLEVRN